MLAIGSAARHSGGSRSRGPRRSTAAAGRSGLSQRVFQPGARFVVVAADAAMAGGGTGFMPAGVAVAGAFEARGIDERLGQQRSVAVLLLPPPGQVPHRFTKDTAGEIGLGVEQAEPRLLHDQFEPLGLRAGDPSR